MADSADILFKHKKKDIGKVKVFRLLDDGSFDCGKELLFGDEWKIILTGPETVFVIECLDSPVTDDIIVQGDAGLTLSQTASDSKKRWELSIVPDNEQPEAPTTVNVSLGEDEPDEDDTT